MLQISHISPKIRETIHEKSLHILENTGVAFDYEPALRLLKKHGARINGKTAYIPANLVQECLATCPASFSLEARNSAKSVVFGQKEDFLVLPNLGPIFVQDAEGQKRHGTMADYINMTKLSHASPVVDVVGSCPIDTVDVDTNTKFLQMVYQSCRHSDKPVMCCTGTSKHIDRQLKIVEISFGQPEIMKNKVITGTSLSPLSPLAYAEDAAHAIMAFAERGQMVIVAVALMAGINAPASIGGSSLMINTEFLAAMVLAQCVGPETPVVYATTSSASNLRNASYVTSTPETALLNCFAVQMGQYYNVPTRSVGTATDAKTMDMQAGYEAMQNLLMARSSGVDAIYETLGVLESLLTVSYEKFMIDQELIARVKSISKGVDAEELAQLHCRDIEETGIGGNFLIHPSTLKACRQRWEPTISDWWPYEKWMEDGSQDVIQKASTQYKDVLKQAPENILDPAIDRQLVDYIEKCS
jgi:trimethylamine--corrinoid protein Co-methyltransferase